MYLMDQLTTDYTFDAFTREMEKVCETAWLNGLRDVTAVKLPRNLFPELTEFLNPITRSTIKVERVDLLDLCTFAVPRWQSS